MHPPYRSFPTGPMFLRTLPIRFTLLGVILPGELRPACSSSPGFHNKCRYRRSLSADGRVRFSLSALSVSRREILNPTAPACIGVSSSRFSLSPHRSPSEAAETIGLDPSMFIRRYRANVTVSVWDVGTIRALKLILHFHTSAVLHDRVLRHMLR